MTIISKPPVTAKHGMPQKYDTLEMMITIIFCETSVTDYRCAEVWKAFEKSSYYQYHMSPRVTKTRIKSYFFNVFMFYLDWLHNGDQSKNPMMVYHPGTAYRTIEDKKEAMENWELTRKQIVDRVLNPVNVKFLQVGGNIFYVTYWQALELRKEIIKEHGRRQEVKRCKEELVAACEQLMWEVEGKYCDLS